MVTWDHHTPFAHAAPISIEQSPLGVIRIEGAHIRPVHPLDPPKISYAGNEVIISHLRCHLHHPERVRGVLKLALMGAGIKRGYSAQQANTIAIEALDRIRAVNLDRLAQLITLCRELTATEPCDGIGADAASRQAAIIRQVLSWEQPLATASSSKPRDGQPILGLAV